MKTAYLSMDMFFGLYDDVQCHEARLVIEKMMKTIEAMREVAADTGCQTKEESEGITYATDQFQEALEDYLCAHSKYHSMLERPLNDPSKN